MLAADTAHRAGRLLKFGFADLVACLFFVDESLQMLADLLVSGVSSQERFEVVFV